MKIGILGTGMVGTSLGTKLVALGNEVKMGSRTADNKAASDWTVANGKGASHGTFEEAASFGEMIIFCAKGDAALDVLKMAKPENLKGKTVIDTTNPLDFSTGVLKLTVCNTDSLGEKLQREAPDAHFVKTLNTIGTTLMVNPTLLGEDLTMFVCGNDASAKIQATEMLKKFGWKDIVDIGGISAARGQEMFLPLWLNVFMLSGGKDADFGIKLVRKK